MVLKTWVTCSEIDCFACQHPKSCVILAEEFRNHHWPWQPFPEVYYDPWALNNDAHTRASLHAKIVVVDRSKLFLTSANFTEAAHQRNIEMGLLSRAAYLAEQVASYFEGLRQSGHLMRLP